VPIFPLVTKGIIPENYHFSFTSLTGYSGGGKSKIQEYEKADNDGINYPKHYALELNHKHLPEIMYHLKLVHAPVFTPVICNFYRGMQVSIPLFSDMLPGMDKADTIFRFLSEYYKNEKFIRVHKLESGEFPLYQNNNTNFIDILVTGRNDQVLILSCIDNLGKGASGAAVQNMNIMLGFEESYNLI
jgi:N-acetyl-gamma-glutamyl-phosphate reductase